MHHNKAMQWILHWLSCVNQLHGACPCLLLDAEAFTHLYVAHIVDEDVFRFEISVDEVESVQVFKGEHHLRRVELGL